MNPRTVLQERYPSVNLILYFAFIDLCRQFEPEPQKGLTHEHHICPKKQFPEHIATPENLVTLYTAVHQHAHKLLGKVVPELSKANAAWIACASENGRIAGRTSQATHKKNGTGCYSREMQVKGGRIGGRIGGRKTKENGTGIFAPEHRGEGGKIGGRKNKENGTGIFGMTLEQRQAAGRKNGRKSKENGTGIFAPGMAAKGGRKHKENGTGIFAPGMQAKGTHNRWHVNRGIVNPKCSFCQKAGAQ